MSEVIKNLITETDAPESQKIKPSKLTRRSFIRKVAGAIGGSGVLANYPWLRETLETEFDPEKTIKEIEETVETIEKLYGLSLDFGGVDVKYKVVPEIVETATANISLPTGDLHYFGEKPKSLKQLRDCVNVFKKDIGKFPPELIKLLGLEKVYFVTNLVSFDSEMEKEELYGAYLQQKRIIILSIQSPRPESVFSPNHVLAWVKDPKFYANSHEFYHAFDEKFNRFVKDDKAYESVSKEARTHPASLLWQYFKDPSRPLGTASEYGNNSKIGEDQGEVMRILFDAPQYAKTQSMGDPELKAKMEFIKRQLYTWSNGRMDKQYWSDLRAGRVNLEYWENSGRGL